MVPQVLTGFATAPVQKLDIWATGVIVFALVTGYPAFYSASPQQMLDNIASGKLTAEQLRLGI